MLGCYLRLLVEALSALVCFGRAELQIFSWKKARVDEKWRIIELGPSF